MNADLYIKVCVVLFPLCVFIRLLHVKLTGIYYIHIVCLQVFILITIIIKVMLFGLVIISSLINVHCVFQLRHSDVT